MIRHVDNDLNTLKDLLLSMGGQVERSLSLLATVFSTGQSELLAEAKSAEKKINDLHLRIDEACMLFMARQAPVATDLRLVLSAQKMNSNLERMGDELYNTVGNYERYLSSTYRKLPPQWVEMLEDVKKMVADSLDAFSAMDVDLSRSVLKSDDVVDCHNTDLTGVIKERMKKAAIEIDAGVEALSMVRNLERVADHATNIAEEVIFVVTGDDIRHGRINSV